MATEVSVHGVMKTNDIITKYAFLEVVHPCIINNKGVPSKVHPNEGTLLYDT